MAVCVSNRQRLGVGRPAGRIAAAAVVILALGGSTTRADTDGLRGETSQDSAAASTGGTERSPAATQERVAELIAELGHPRYTTRRAAANELRQIGAEAFDALHSATEATDPEVAASAHYLLRQINVRWVRPDDSAAVRRLLRDYGSMSDELRLHRIAELAALDGNDGVAALCRVARFDRSPLLARTAALAVIRPDERPAASLPVDPETIEDEIGDSARTAVAWLRQYRSQLRDPAASLAGWSRLVDAEAARLEQNVGETTGEIVLGLLWNLADVHRTLNDRESLLAVVDRMVRLDADEIEGIAVDLLLWFVDQKSWEALDAFLARYQRRLEQSKRPLYVAAMARAEQGKEELASQLAEKAAGLESQGLLESFSIAKELELRGRFEWSVREYRRAFDKQEVVAHESILARVSLANLLYDYEQHAEAADVLEPLVKKVREDPQAGHLYNEVRRHHLRRSELALPERDALAARFHFYCGLAHHDDEQWAEARQHLEAAIKFDGTDADVLIAMYRLPESDDEWRESTLLRINNLARQLQRQIDDSPGDPSTYNQWAWLISNTEGDYQQAIRYSHRSLELLPPGAESASASFLDTLGRCYYAAGDYENAVKYQRQALERVDYMQVMHRQMKLFEKALAEQEASAGGEAAPDDTESPGSGASPVSTDET